MYNVYIHWLTADVYSYSIHWLTADVYSYSYDINITAFHSTTLLCVL